MPESNGKQSPIAITGCGWITPFAAGAWEDVIKFAANHGGVAAQEPFASVPDAFQERCQRLPAELKRDHGGWIAALGVEQAIRSAGLELAALESVDVGFMLGSALTGLDGMIVFADEVRKQSPRFVSPLHFPQTVGNYVAGAIARGYGVRGPNVTMAGGIESAAQAIVEAVGTLRSGRASMIIAGGWDVLTEPLARGLQHVAAPKSEGACFFVLESVESAKNRGGNVLAIINSDSKAEADRRSVAGAAEPHDIKMDYWTGWSGAAGGAAAVLGGIAALHDFAVPVVDDGSVRSIAIKRCEGAASVTVHVSSDGSTAQPLKLRLDRP